MSTPYSQLPESHMLNRDQKRRIALLQQAIWQLQRAISSVNEALACGLELSWHNRTIAELITDLEDNIDSVYNEAERAAGQIDDEMLDILVGQPAPTGQ